MTPLALAALLLSPPAPHPARTAPPPLAAETVLRTIAAEGAAQALESLYATDRSWGGVLRGVRSGTRPWLQVAAELKAAGGPSATELIGAVAEALEHSPANVLAILGGGTFDANNVCSLGTFEDLLGPSYSAALRHVQARERAVASVRDPALAPAREECLAFLRELQTNVERNQKDWFEQP